MSPGFALPDRPLSAALDAELTRLRNQIPTGQRGYATAGVSLKGFEVGAAWSPARRLTLAGYAARQWGTASWEAGARATVTW